MMQLRFHLGEGRGGWPLRRGDSFFRMGRGSGLQVYCAEMGGFRIELAEGVMKLAEGVTSKLCFLEIFVGKMDKHIRAEDLRKRCNTIGGAGH